MSAASLQVCNAQRPACPFSEHLHPGKPSVAGGDICDRMSATEQSKYQGDDGTLIRRLRRG